METKFEPKDPDYQSKVIRSFKRQAVMKTLGATIQSVAAGKIELAFPYQSALTQQHGFIHAGIVSTILDSACGYAAFSLMPNDAAVLTVEFKVNLLAPAKGARFRAVGRVKKPGRTIIVTEGELFAETDGTEKLVATMSGTIMTVYNRKGIEM